MKIWGIHRVFVDEVMSPRKGLFFVRSWTGKAEETELVEISLVLCVVGLRKQLQFIDYQHGVVNARVEYWCRLTLELIPKRRLKCLWGTVPAVGRLERLNRVVHLYQEAK